MNAGRCQGPLAQVSSTSRSPREQVSLCTHQAGSGDQFRALRALALDKPHEAGAYQPHFQLPVNGTPFRFPSDRPTTAKVP